jgi:adenine-specific DNA-methyltransferase
VENAMKIDAILAEIASLKQECLINQVEEAVLRAALIEAVTRVSNVSGTYGAFLKVDDKRKFKLLIMNPLHFIPGVYENECYNEDIFNLIDHVEGDILYLDPPVLGSPAIL